MKNSATDKWDIGWRSIGSPKSTTLSRSTGQSPVAVVPPPPPAAQQPSGGVVVKSIAHPQKPKVPATAPVAVKVSPQQTPAAVDPVAQTKQDTPRVTPAKIQPSQNKAAPAKDDRDLHGGMELLGVEFILNLAEKTDFDTRDEAVMHNIGLNELIRRDNFDRLNSKTLAAYATNDGDFYSKQIQCSAMQVLAQRTAGDNE